MNSNGYVSCGIQEECKPQYKTTAARVSSAEEISNKLNSVLEYSSVVSDRVQRVLANVCNNAPEGTGRDVAPIMCMPPLFAEYRDKIDEINYNLIKIMNILDLCEL